MSTDGPGGTNYTATGGHAKDYDDKVLKFTGEKPELFEQFSAQVTVFEELYASDREQTTTTTGLDLSNARDVMKRVLDDADTNGLSEEVLGLVQQLLLLPTDVSLGGMAWSNDLSHWLEFAPFELDPVGQSGAVWHSYANNACSHQSCWEQTIVPVAQRVPVVVTEMGHGISWAQGELRSDDIGRQLR